MARNSYKTAMIFGILTYVMWGVFPIYFKSLENISATEVLAHRIIWSVVFLLVLLKFKHRIKSILRYAHNKKLLKMLFLTGAIISINWGVYIYAVSTDRILYASLGYLINPLFSILLGAIFLKERLDIWAKIAVGFAFLGILNEFYALGEVPFISLILPASFAIYGLLKKQIKVPATEGLFFETILVFPFAIFYLIFLQVKGVGTFGANFGTILLFFSGLVTILPLITFNIAAKSLKLQTMGFLQYISPCIAILVAVLIYGESLEMHKIISFTMIAISLVIVSLGGILRRKNG